MAFGRPACKVHLPPGNALAGVAGRWVKKLRPSRPLGKSRPLASQMIFTSADCPPVCENGWPRRGGRSGLIVTGKVGFRVRFKGGMDGKNRTQRLITFLQCGS
jgi:hypothetical protein